MAAKKEFCNGYIDKFFELPPKFYPDDEEGCFIAPNIDKTNRNTQSFATNSKEKVNELQA